MLMKILQSVDLCQTLHRLSLDMMASLDGLLWACDATPSHVSPITLEFHSSQRARWKPSNRPAFVRDEHRLDRVFEDENCGPRNTVEATGKVLKCLNSIMSCHLTTAVRDVNMPRAVAASDLVSLIVAAKFARSLSVARGSRWAITW